MAPRTLALRQRLKACLSAIHCSHETRLDDECAFYTSRAPPPGPTRVCTNPVATLLEWQDALVSLQSMTMPCLHSKPVEGVGWGTAGLGSFSKMQWECNNLSLSLSSVSFQLVLGPLRALHHEAPPSTNSSPANLTPFSFNPYLLLVCPWDWEPTSFCPSINFLKCPNVQPV